MADPDHYKNSREVIEINEEYRVSKHKVEILTAEWEALNVKMEKFKTGIGT